METITEKTTKILGLLIPTGDIDSKVRKIIGEDLKRKLIKKVETLLKYTKRLGEVLTCHS